MGINLWYMKAWLSAAVLCISFFFLSFSPPGSYASELIYTVQTGSFSNEADAQAEYDFIMHTLNGEKLDYLRIERIGKFYVVRLGKFEGHADTERLFREIESHLSDVLIMEAYMKDERIKRIHRVSLPLDRQGVKEQMEADNLKPPPSLKRDLFSSGNSMYQLKRKAEEKVLGNMELKATIIDGQDPLAIIGDEVLGVGGSVKGLEVTAIKNNEVILSKGGSQYILRMNKE